MACESLERTRKARAKKKAQGFVNRSLWLYPNELDKVKAYLDKLRTVN